MEPATAPTFTSPPPVTSIVPKPSVRMGNNDAGRGGSSGCVEQAIRSDQDIVHEYGRTRTDVGDAGAGRSYRQAAATPAGIVEVDLAGGAVILAKDGDGTAEDAGIGHIDRAVAIFADDQHAVGGRA